MEKNPKFRRPEPSISKNDPWADDALDRREYANRLTELIGLQSEPFVISLDGHWGTGKTFFLKRWKVHLERKGVKVIYFNAWEDDFIDDPLIALLSELFSLTDTGKYRELVKKIKCAAIPLIKNNIKSVMSHYTGITPSGWEDKVFERYSEQTENREKLKKKLRKMSETLKEENVQQLVFIVDELDRCRPSFAIELLERVKHVFDIPGIVFVFGINQSELCAAIRSIYGEIRSDVYIRRFFDMETTLPDVGREKFFDYAIRGYGLKDFFKDLGGESDRNIHRDEFAQFSQLFVQLSEILELSLRDIDFCLRTMSLVGKNLEPNHFMFPYIIGILLPLRLKNEGLYRKFLEGKQVASEIVNYITNMELTRGDKDRSERDFGLDFMEAYLYRLAGGDLLKVRNQLDSVASGNNPSGKELLSIRSRTSGKEHAKEMLKELDRVEREIPSVRPSWRIIKYVRGLLEVVQPPE